MQEPLTIELNGVERAFQDLGPSCSVADLIAALEFRADRVALERNGEVLSRAAWPTTLLRSGDRIELVHFVGGGSVDPQD